MNTYEKAGAISFIASEVSIALGLLASPWFLVFGIALAGATVALKIVADENR